MRKPVKTSLSQPERNALARLRSRPEERPSTRPMLISLQRDGLAVGVPLIRPSGKPSRYREWSITPRGLELLGKANG